MVVGPGNVGPRLGSAFCHELSEVVLNPLELSFAKEGRGRWALGTGWTGGGHEEGLEKQWADPSLGLGFGLLQTLVSG